MPPQIRRRPQMEEGDPLTYSVIGEAMKVHRDLGPGLDERFYHVLLADRLRFAGVAHESKPRGELLHRGLAADTFECDLYVDHRLIVELKALAASKTFAPEHLVQILCYLKFWRANTGLLLDFGKERLFYRRVVFTEKVTDPLTTGELMAQCPDIVADRELTERVCGCLIRIYESHGLGYRDTTYQGLLVAELTSEELHFKNYPVASIRCDSRKLGEAACNCLVIGGTLAIMVMALRDHITTTDRAVLQTYQRHLNLNSGLIVNFGKRTLQTEFVAAPQHPQPLAPESSSAVVSESAGNSSTD